MDVCFRRSTPTRMRMTVFGDRRGDPAPTRRAGTRTEPCTGQPALAKRVRAGDRRDTSYRRRVRSWIGRSVCQPGFGPGRYLGVRHGDALPLPSDEVRYPNLSRFTDPVDRFAYKSAYSDCRLIGVEGTAEAFGGDPDAPSSVARAYAVAIFRESEEHREATSQGCLDAFEAEAE